MPSPERGVLIDFGSRRRVISQQTEQINEAPEEVLDGSFNSTVEPLRNALATLRDIDASAMDQALLLLNSFTSFLQDVSEAEQPKIIVNHMHEMRGNFEGMLHLNKGAILDAKRIPIRH